MVAPTAENGGLLERLARGPVICAEGYVWELARRGYLQAGAFVPEVVLDGEAWVKVPSKTSGRPLPRV